MANHLAQDLQAAYFQLIELSGSVEQMIEQSVSALMHKDRQTASAVIAGDREIDRREVQIEENCLTILALHQPVAADLRRIAMMLKINNELEQMADLACNIAQRAEALAEQSGFAIPELMTQLADSVRAMVKDSLNAFINSDEHLAYRVLAADDGVDQINAQIIAAVERSLADRAANVSDAMHCFSASRHLEQIADHATSVAEDVIYMVSGDIVRHRRTLSQHTADA